MLLRLTLLITVKRYAPILPLLMLPILGCQNAYAYISITNHCNHVDIQTKHASTKDILVSNEYDLAKVIPPFSQQIVYSIIKDESQHRVRIASYSSEIQIHPRNTALENRSNFLSIYKYLYNEQNS